MYVDTGVRRANSSRRRRRGVSGFTRRGALGGLAATPLVLSGCEGLPGVSEPAMRKEGEISPSGLDWAGMKWARGIENQRRADLGDGRYLNPILSGDHPD